MEDSFQLLKVIIFLGSWPRSTSSKPAADSDSLFSHPLPLLRTQVTRIGPPGQSRIIFPSQVLNLNTSVESLLPCKVTCSQVLGIRTGHLWGPFSPHTLITKCYKPSVLLLFKENVYFGDPISVLPGYTWRVETGRADSSKVGQITILFNAQIFRATGSELTELYPSNHTWGTSATSGSDSDEELFNSELML